MKKLRVIFAGLLIIVAFNAMGSEPKLKTVNSNFFHLNKDSIIFYNDVEIRILIDSTHQIIIPAKTAGTLYEIKGDQKGEYYMFVIQFTLEKETTCSVSFLRKELVDKRVKICVKNKKGKMVTKKIITEPKSFVLRGEVETIYRGRKSSNIPSIPRDAQVCNLLVQ